MWNLWSLLLAILSLIAAVVSLPENSSYKPWVVTLIAITCFILATYTLLRYVHVRGLLAWLQIRESLGIISIYQRGSGRYDELYNRISASRSLKIMAVSAESLVRFSEHAIVAALVQNNCEVKLLIAKEGASFVSEVENLEGSHRQGQIHTEIAHTKTRLIEILRLADKQVRSKNKSMGRIWVGRYESALRSSLIICDNSWGWMTPNFSPKRAIDSVSFVLGQAPNGLLEDCINQFDAVWNLYKETVEEVIVSGNESAA